MSATDTTKDGKVFGKDVVGITVADVLGEEIANLSAEDRDAMENGDLRLFAERAIAALNEAADSPACIVDWRPQLVSALRAVLRLCVSLAGEIDFCDVAFIGVASSGQPDA